MEKIAMRRTGGLRRQFNWGLLACTAWAWAGSCAATDAPACDGSPTEARVHLTVEPLRSARGNITVTLYPDDEARFMASGGKLLRIRVPAVQPATQTCLVLPSAGRYEIAVYHDEDDDHQFNRTWLGLPDEGYGFSNNPKLRLGLPSIEQARFSAGIGDTTLVIRLRY